MSLIAAIEGALEATGLDYALVRVGGVTLEVHVPAPDLASLGVRGATVRLHTHLVVREDDLQLYGFVTEPGRRLFQSLLDVSGVGPKGALAVLSIAQVEGIAAAIVAGDANTLSQAQGVGKRTAERIILDLRGKLEEEFGPVLAAGTVTPVVDQDPAFRALAALGYSALEVRQALSVEQDDDLSVEERVRRALQRMGQPS